MKNMFITIVMLVGMSVGVNAAIIDEFFPTQNFKEEDASNVAYAKNVAIMQVEYRDGTKKLCNVAIFNFELGVTAASCLFHKDHGGFIKRARMRSAFAGKTVNITKANLVDNGWRTQHDARRNLGLVKFPELHPEILGMSFEDDVPRNITAGVTSQSGFFGGIAYISPSKVINWGYTPTDFAPGVRNVFDGNSRLPFIKARISLTRADRSVVVGAPVGEVPGPGSTLLMGAWGIIVEDFENNQTDLKEDDGFIKGSVLAIRALDEVAQDAIFKLAERM